MKEFEANHGMKPDGYLLIKAFTEGGLSMGQLARSLDRSVSETAKLLSVLSIPVLDYELEDELDTLARIQGIADHKPPGA